MLNSENINHQEKAIFKFLGSWLVVDDANCDLLLETPIEGKCNVKRHMDSFVFAGKKKKKSKV